MRIPCYDRSIPYSVVFCVTSGTFITCCDMCNDACWDLNVIASDRKQNGVLTWGLVNKCRRVDLRDFSDVNTSFFKQSMNIFCQPTSCVSIALKYRTVMIF